MHHHCLPLRPLREFIRKIEDALLEELDLAFHLVILDLGAKLAEIVDRAFSVRRGDNLGWRETKRSRNGCPCRLDGSYGISQRAILEVRH